jgi:CBS domain containing-hemolysin-like protein
MPVIDRPTDRFIGVLHTRDVVTAYVSGAEASLSTLLRPLVRVALDTPADQLLAFLREKRTHQAFVIRTDGRIVGLVTLEDVVAELLGDMADEFKGARRRLRVPEGRR